MFHVKQEKRALASANLIYEGLCQCMERKEFAQISIQDVQTASTVSRSTFYRHFDSLTDVLYWRCNQLFQQMFSDFQLSTADDPYHFTHHLLQYWTTHTQILEQLLQIQRADLFYRCHMDNLPLFQQTATPSTLPAQYQDYFMALRTGILLGVLTTWLKNGKQESVEELLNILKLCTQFIQESELII